MAATLNTAQHSIFFSFFFLCVCTGKNTFSKKKDESDCATLTKGGPEEQLTKQREKKKADAHSLHRVSTVLWDDEPLLQIGNIFFFSVFTYVQTRLFVLVRTRVGVCAVQHGVHETKSVRVHPNIPFFSSHARLQPQSRRGCFSLLSLKKADSRLSRMC